MASQTITKQVALKASGTLLAINNEFSGQSQLPYVSTTSIGDRLNRISQILVIGTLGTIIAPSEGKRSTGTILYHYDYSNGYQSSASENVQDAVLRFAETLIEKSKKIEPEIQQSIQKRFWDLI